MANLLKVNEQAAIKTLAAQGWGIRRIARELNLHRKTVKRYLLEEKVDSKCTAISTAGKMGRKSQCLVHAERIEKKAAEGLSAQRIYQDLRVEAEFVGSYESVKRFVKKLRQSDPQRVWRIEVQPGEEAQVDFGVGAVLVGAEGRRTKSWVFRMILSYSRKGYSEAVLHQNTESFIRCLENGFRHFGGVPQTVNLDNLKAAVLKSDWAEPELNPKLAQFARHYGTVILPCIPRRPQHKGKIENGIGYVKGNLLAGRRITSLTQENQLLAHWEKSVADVRIHGTTKRQVAQMFAEEQKGLQPLPAGLFPCFEEGRRLVHRDSYVEVKKAYYAVPPEYIGQQVWVRWDAREVRLFNQKLDQIQMHCRLEPGKFSKVLGIGGGHGSLRANLDYWSRRASELGGPCAQWAQGLVQQRGIEAMRSLMGLVSLTEHHTLCVINTACAKAIAQDAWQLRQVKALLETAQVQTHFAFSQQHPLIRDLSEYGLFIKTQNPL